MNNDSLLADVNFEDFKKEISEKAYDDAFWDKLSKSFKKHNEEYEKLCKNMEIDPISGKSTMSWEERNREFNC